MSVLNLYFSHEVAYVSQGDFVIMDGAGIQKLYEVCHGRLRALLTTEYLPPIARSGTARLPICCYGAPHYMTLPLSLLSFCPLVS